MWIASDRAFDAITALKARPRRRRLPPDLGERQIAAVAPNVLDRTFEAPAPNRKRIATYDARTAQNYGSVRRDLALGFILIKTVQTQPSL